jgi:cytochrome c-type biogenesis protein CcmH
MLLFVSLALLAGVVAAAFATWPLWRHHRRLAIGLSLAVLLAAAGLYRLEGEPLALDPANVVAPTTIADAIGQLERRLAVHPEEFEGRVLLARSYMAEQKYAQARDAYALATTQQPDDSDLKVEYAEALLRTSADHRFPPTAVAMLENAVERNPQNQRALFFLGLERMQSGQPAEAAALWQRLLPLLPADAGAEVRKQIDSARQAANLPPLPAAAEPVPLLKVRVAIDPTLARMAQPGAVLFVFARSSNGSGPPLAVVRVAVENLPADVTLSDADSPMPTAKLSAQSRVIVMARLSLSGDAQAASGDIEADPQNASVGQADRIELVLNRPVP